MREAARVVARHVVFDQEIGAQGLDAQLAHRVEVKLDGLSALRGVTLQKCGRKRPLVEDDVVEELEPGVLVEGVHVVGG